MESLHSQRKKHIKFQKPREEIKPARRYVDEVTRKQLHMNVMPEFFGCLSRCHIHGFFLRRSLILVFLGSTMDPMHSDTNAQNHELFYLRSEYWFYQHGVFGRVFAYNKAQRLVICFSSKLHHRRRC